MKERGVNRTFVGFTDYSGGCADDEAVAADFILLDNAVAYHNWEARQTFVSNDPSGIYLIREIYIEYL